MHFSCCRSFVIFFRRFLSFSLVQLLMVGWLDGVLFDNIISFFFLRLSSGLRLSFTIESYQDTLLVACMPTTQCTITDTWLLLIIFFFGVLLCLLFDWLYAFSPCVALFLFRKLFSYSFNRILYVSSCQLPFNSIVFNPNCECLGFHAILFISFLSSLNRCWSTSFREGFFFETTIAYLIGWWFTTIRRSAKLFYLFLLQYYTDLHGLQLVCDYCECCYHSSRSYVCYKTLHTHTRKKKVNKKE